MYVGVDAPVRYQVSQVGFTVAVENAASGGESPPDPKINVFVTVLHHRSAPPAGAQEERRDLDRGEPAVAL